MNKHTNDLSGALRNVMKASSPHKAAVFIPEAAGREWATALITRLMHDKCAEKHI